MATLKMWLSNIVRAGRSTFAAPGLVLSSPPPPPPPPLPCAGFPRMHPTEPLALRDPHPTVRMMVHELAGWASRGLLGCVTYRVLTHPPSHAGQVQVGRGGGGPGCADHPPPPPQRCAHPQPQRPLRHRLGTRVGRPTAPAAPTTTTAVRPTTTAQPGGGDGFRRRARGARCAQRPVHGAAAIAGH